MRIRGRVGDDRTGCVKVKKEGYVGMVVWEGVGNGGGGWVCGGKKGRLRG